MIVVVGIGADGVAGLSPASRAELSRATVIYGSQRQLDLLDESASAVKRPWPSPMLPALRTLLDDVDGDVHVVASGDPLLHGVGSSLIRLFGADQVSVLPHVSSVTLACARVGWSVQDTEIISLVSHEPRTAVRRGGQAIVLSRDRTSPASLARLLTDTGRGESELTVLEQLGGPRELRRSSTAREWAGRPPGSVDDLNVMAVRYLPDERVFATLPDDSFAHDGQITKQAVRAVTLAALAPRPGELLWDVGAGSGSVAIEWCRSGIGCRAIAFERDEARRARIVENAVTFGVLVDATLRRAGVVRRLTASRSDLRRWRCQSAGVDGRLLGQAARRWPAGRQRGHRGVGSCSRAMVLSPRRKAEQVPELPRRAGRVLHRVAPGDAGHAVVGAQADGYDLTSSMASSSRIARQPRCSIVRIISSPRSVDAAKANPSVVSSGAWRTPRR